MCIIPDVLLMLKKKKDMFIGPSGIAKSIYMGTGVRRSLHSLTKLSGPVFVWLSGIARGKLVEEFFRPLGHPV